MCVEQISSWGKAGRRIGRISSAGGDSFMWFATVVGFFGVNGTSQCPRGVPRGLGWGVEVGGKLFRLEWPIHFKF